MIVEWGNGAKSFSSCGLPMPPRRWVNPTTPEPEECCHPSEQIAPAINWCDWAKWLPEVGIGIEDFEEDVAAAYVREAAIEFAKRSYVLQRSVFIELQPDVFSYQLDVPDNERIVDVMAVLDGNFQMHTGGEKASLRAVASMKPFTNTVVLAPQFIRHCCCHPHGHGYIELLVWATPTEDACVHDRILYDGYRAAITSYARLLYVMALHYTNRGLVSTLQPVSVFNVAVARAKNEATRWLEVTRAFKPKRPLFG